MPQCTSCQTEFTLTPTETEMLKKFSFTFDNQNFSLPLPNQCFDCRQKRRLSFRNERALYHRKCDLSGETIISIYKPDSPYKVYSPKSWWSDNWNPLDYGRDFDFTRPFFEQLNDLKKSVPHLSLHVTNNENSEYVNLSGYNKNCHLIFAAEYNEDCLYGTQIIKSTNCLDTLNCYESNHCYEVIDVENCYQLLYSQDCKNCNDSLFLFNCRNSSNCLFSSNLRNKKNYIFNKPHSPEEFEQKKQQILKHLQAGKIDELQSKFQELKKSTPHKSQSLTNCDNCTGDFISNSKNCQFCFDVTYGEDCCNTTTGFQVKDTYDVCHTTEAELSYNSMSIGYKSYNVISTNGAWSSNNIIHCDHSHSSSNIFGCSNIRNAKYCVFNKQYSQSDYEVLVAKIINHMQETGEWGQFFPSSMSPFNYEDTLANEYYPQIKKDNHYTGPIPPNSIICSITGRPFQLTATEQKFYEKMQLPPPTKHPDQRHKERFHQRPPRQILERHCHKCQTEIHTAFTEDKAPIVYCEKCYLSEIY